MQKVLAYIVIFCLISLIITSIYKTLIPKISENMTGNMETTYKDPELSNDPVYLAKLNAANIAYLKEQIDGISQIKSDFEKIHEQVESNSMNIQGLNQAIESTKDSIPGTDVTSALADTGNTIPPGAT